MMYWYVSQADRYEVDRQIPLSWVAVYSLIPFKCLKCQDKCSRNKQIPGLTLSWEDSPLDSITIIIHPLIMYPPNQKVMHTWQGGSIENFGHCQLWSIMSVIELTLGGPCCCRVLTFDLYDIIWETLMTSGLASYTTLCWWIASVWWLIEFPSIFECLTKGVFSTEGLYWSQCKGSKS